MSHYKKYLCLASVPVGLIYLGYLSPSIMRESPMKASAHQLVAAKPLLSLQHIEELKTNGIVIIDNVLSQVQLENVSKDIKVMSLGKKFVFNENESASDRSDLVVWIAECIGKEQQSVIGPSLLHALRCIRSIPFELSNYGYDQANLGVPFSNQLACFDGGGARYAPHRDKPEASTGWSNPLKEILYAGLEERRFTIILYLNGQEWDSSAGGYDKSGNLRCYLGADMDDLTGETSTNVVDIEPIGGRLVIFDATKVLHEVMPSGQRRIALTSWVGGSHSTNEWLRPFCVPQEEFNWTQYIRRLLNQL